MEVTNKPVLQSFHLSGVKHISPKETWKVLQNNEALLVDVREDHEIAIESIQHDPTVYQPMSSIMQHLNELPKDKPLIVVCKKGVRSSKIVNLLKRQGYETVVNLDGGMHAWKKQKLPLDSIFDGDGCHDCHGDCSKC
ncbi:putative adenylyltransferase/sulfurtransferase MoeZ [Salinivirga cyanobacteriivorans]|uniref:Putative adenylyltransferase/sulfurtransferase MoeZ n=1 Tax=Salinivirga cyanobacteriivorans TaxID=1307839 RepID=A0A0S2I1P8_9BACT|nr:rhodanese-like domain-containing protein [Salinivirga cyanobacteriivorans]ALO16194.1 putative adenylyltransferase/sulfurtransferase MoeZ [Salinivirga cyanobacteriivorans]